MNAAVHVYYVIACSIYGLIVLLFITLWAACSKPTKDSFRKQLLEAWGRGPENLPSMSNFLNRNKVWICYEVVISSIFFWYLDVISALIYILLLCIIGDFIYSGLVKAYGMLRDKKI